MNLMGVPMGNFLLATFLYPGNAACDMLGLGQGDDRMMVRTLVNMLVWNCIAVLIVVAIF
ncbi:MAG: hypothetical protein IT555_14635 [Acetobacteraceae bacterium]|nr:hypothetical protein [Acetobacteraceae bacterium]